MFRTRISRCLACLIALMLLASCVGGSNWDRSSDTHYTVRSGDTLFSIAFRFDLDHNSLARWNNISDPTLIYPGQVLRLTGAQAVAGSTTRSGTATRPRTGAPTSEPRIVRSNIAWQWPTAGRVVSTFSLTASASRTGVLISGQRGQPILAAAAGEVVYSGSGLKGYGKLIIIKHDSLYLSAYGHNSALLVAEGDHVAAGEKIASMGETSAQKPRLHFEIRRDGKPIDPLPLLGSR